MAAEAAEAAQSVTVAFDVGDVVSEVLDSCTMSRKYVINSPRSCNYSTVQKKTLKLFTDLNQFCRSLIIAGFRLV